MMMSLSYTRIRQPNVLPVLFGMSGEQYIEYVESTEEQEDVKMHMHLGIPDDMLKCFDQQYPIQRLLSRTFPGPTKFLFKRQSQTWRATAYDHYHAIPDSASTQRQLTLKLSHDGFRYHARKYVAHNVRTHDRDDYYLLGSDVLADMPHLKHLAHSLGAKILFYYSIKHRRIDIKFFKDDSDYEFL
ncbi:hypothetical protein HK102_005194 [Quaeritorhiza haematococci]|nr:hypothetical protein HK102_005194 [Quaeritorhiza haematococci]